MVLLYLMSILAVGGLLLRWPHLILRPSVWFSLLMIIQINGAAAFIEAPLQWHLFNIDAFRLLALLFPFAVLVWVAFTPGISRLGRQMVEQSRGVSLGWLVGGGSCETQNSPGDAPAVKMKRTGVFNVEKRLTLFIAGYSVLIIGIYLFLVPLNTTGLYMILTNPAMAAIAREESLKLLPYAWLRYGFVFHIAIFAPLLAAILAQIQLRWFSWKSACRLVGIVLIVASVMLSGARMPGGMIIMVLGLVFLLRIGIRKGAVVFAVTIVWMLVQAAILTILRQGQSDVFTFGLLWDILVKSMYERIFVVPYQTGVWTNLYAQNEGLLGVTNIRPLALLLGEKHVGLPNLVGLAYMKSRILSVSANTCFLFDYQASFGLFRGWLVSLVLLFGLDLFLVCFRKLSGRILVAFLAVFLMSIFTLVSSNFTTSLLTHGIGAIALLALVFGQWGARQEKLHSSA